MKRREFIYGLSGVAALSFAGSYLYVNREIEYDPVIAEPFFLSHIWNTESIIEAGEKYLAVAKKSDEQDLVRQIIKENGAKGPDSVQKINEQIAVDFKNEQTVLVDGWILSLTEARHCGLYSLIQET